MSYSTTTGKSSFEIEVSYKLVESGSPDVHKPLIVYLHGFGQNAYVMEKKLDYMLSFEAYHLFIDAPYLVFDTSRKKELSKWGRSWYVYDGSQAQFLKSLEKGTAFLEKLIQDIQKQVLCSRICILGYSMGGYLGGYFALSKNKLVSEAIIIGARIKTEVFDDQLDEAKDVSILALHGKDDTSVYPEPQHKEILKLKDKGFNATFIEVDCGHELCQKYMNHVVSWLYEVGYKRNK